MPWVLEAMKDVSSCDKLRGAAEMNLKDLGWCAKEGDSPVRVSNCNIVVS